MSIDSYTYIGYYFECNGKKDNVYPFDRHEIFWNPPLNIYETDIWLSNISNTNHVVIDSCTEGIQNIPDKNAEMHISFTTAENTLKDHYNDVKLCYGVVTYYL